MKYTQFLELDKILNENNVSVKDIKKNPEVLNEVGLGLIAGIVAGGLGLTFRKYLLRWGIKSFYLKKFQRIGETFKEKTLENASKVAKQYASFRKEIVNKEQLLKNKTGPEADAERTTLKQSKEAFDKKISTDVLSYVTRLAGNKTNEIYERIDSLKRLKAHQKTALKGLWETIIIDTKIAAFKKLVTDGIITDPTVVGEFETEYQEEKKDVKTKLQKLKKLFGGENEEDEQQTPSNTAKYDVIIEAVDELNQESTDREFIKERVKKLIGESKTLSAKEQRKIKEKIVNTFEFIKFKEPVEPVKQSALKKVDL